MFTASLWTLGNPLEVVVHYLLIGGTTGLDYQDEIPMISTIVCTITHYTGLMMSYKIRLSVCHDFTKLL